MSLLILTGQNLDAIKASLSGLSAGATPVWGSLTPTQMLAHLRCSIEISLGERTVPDASNLFTRHLLRPMALYLMPRWPRGKIKAPPVFFEETSQTLDAERRALFAALDHFDTIASATPERRTLHPIFGPMSLQVWRRLHGLHIRHHLSQFGLA